VDRCFESAHDSSIISSTRTPASRACITMLAVPFEGLSSARDRDQNTPLSQLGF
jgi:hypothetical protein